MIVLLRRLFGSIFGFMVGAARGTRRWFAAKVLTPVAAQLRQGISPEKLAVTIAVGAAIGVFPVLGATTALCFFCALALRLNQPVIQLTNYLVYPLQIPLIYFFVRFGERLLGSRHVSFRVEELVRALAADPSSFFARFAMTGLHAIVGWSIAAAPAAVLVYFLLLPLLRKIDMTRQSAVERAAS